MLQVSIRTGYYTDYQAFYPKYHGGFSVNENPAVCNPRITIRLTIE